MKIAWIGTGIMGSPMATHLAKAGYQVKVYNRTLEKAEKLKDFVQVTYSIQECVKDVDVVFTMLGYPSDVNEVVLEVFKHVKKGVVAVDMTTSSPKLAQELYQKGQTLKIEVLDAPVTGGEVGAINKELSIMVGGSYEVYQNLKSLFDILGKKVTYMGAPGKGQTTKLANQIAIAGSLVGVVEALYFAKVNNLNLELVYQVLANGSAASNQLTQNGKKMIISDYKPGFYVKHFLKDLKLALESIDKQLFVAKRVKEMLEVLVKNDYQDLGTQSLILGYLDNLFF